MKNNDGRMSHENDGNARTMKTITEAFFWETKASEKEKLLDLLALQFDENLSTTTGQAEVMLFSLSVMIDAVLTNNNSMGNENLLERNYDLFGKALEVLPNLGRRSLVVLRGTLPLLSTSKLIRQFQRLLEFICGSVARDASCAHEIWVMMASMIDPSVASIKVQSMILRLYPLLCKTNKRLYGRICESLGTYVSHPNAQLRVVTASTICELAKEDLIRDVSDVIGWVQSYLEDEEDLIIYHAILCLYYLVIVGELDYIIVLKVLKKKLVKFDENISNVLGLSDIVIEAFVTFLGVGESTNDDSSESEDEDDVGRSTSPHVQLSIKTLCNLTLADGILQTSNFPPYESSKMRIIEQLYLSLSQYSAQSFDIDEDIICQEEYADDNQYYQLRKIVDVGKTMVESYNYFKDNKVFASSVKLLTLKLEEIEQYSPISMRWLQQHRKL